MIKTIGVGGLTLNRRRNKRETGTTRSRGVNQGMPMLPGRVSPAIVLVEHD